MLNVHEDFNNLTKSKINFLFFELKSRELNLALRETIVLISKILGEILKGMSNIILQLMSGTVHYLLRVRDRCFGVRDKDFF